MSEQSVVVEHLEKDSWAMVIVVNRSAYGRRSVVPMIFCCSDSGEFASCPLLRQWERSGLVCAYRGIAPERREEILRNAVGEFVRQVSLRSFIKERSRVGIVARAKASKVEKPIEFFGLSRDAEPCLFWLCERSANAYQALKVARFLAEKNNLGELTQAEIETAAMKNITRGETLKNASAKFRFITGASK